MTLQEAWEKRKKPWAEGSRLIEEGNKLWKEVAAMPGTGSVRLGVWFNLSEDSAQAAAKVSAGYQMRMAADQIWHDAIAEEKGARAKMVWTYDAAKNGYGCTLESGEVFDA